jgi:predicted helicase
MNITQLTHVESFDVQAKFKEYTKKAVFRCIGKETNPLDEWISLIEDETRTTKQKGDLFEVLCKHYLVYKKFKQVWVLNELPDDIRQKLKLRKQDLGIDLIALDKNGSYHAIQAKFRGRCNAYKKYAHGKHVPQVTWKEISTFDALCKRTGPYKLHWVITTGDRIKRIGKKQNTDRSVCYRSLLRLNKSDFWCNMAEMKGSRLDSDVKNKNPYDQKNKIDFIRRARARWTSMIKTN